MTVEAASEGHRGVTRSSRPLAHLAGRNHHKQHTSSSGNSMAMQDHMQHRSNLWGVQRRLTPWVSRCRSGRRSCRCRGRLREVPNGASSGRSSGRKSCITAIIRCILSRRSSKDTAGHLPRERRCLVSRSPRRSAHPTSRDRQTKCIVGVSEVHVNAVCGVVIVVYVARALIWTGQDHMRRQCTGCYIKMRANEPNGRDTKAVCYARPYQPQPPRNTVLLAM